MLSNNTGPVFRELWTRHSEKMALLLNPSRPNENAFRYRYAIDNAAFKKFDERAFFRMLTDASKHQKPLFVVCPDVVGCHDRTIALWHYYYPTIKTYGYPVAFVAQDGCSPGDIPDEADWIFIGGNDPWKMENAHRFVGNRPVHVGRVNGIGRLKYCESIGVASVDGTGWLRARGKQFNDIINYFKGQERQMELWRADQK